MAPESQPAVASASMPQQIAPVMVWGRRLTAPVVLGLAALVRFYHLAGQSLWSDEGNSVALARRSFSEIAHRTAFDIHPPLYYWLLKIWISLFGDSEVGLRSLSVGLAVGLVYVIGVLGTRLFSARVGLLAAFIAALSPLQIYYAQEARMYMLLALLSSLTVLGTILLLEGYFLASSPGPPKRGAQIRFPPTGGLRGLTYAVKNCCFQIDLSLARGLWLGGAYVFIVTAGLYTHYAYPLILVVTNLIVLVSLFLLPQIGQQHRTPKIGYWLSLQFIPVLLYLPWLPIAWRQITTWPSERQGLAYSEILGQVGRTLLVGLSWPWGGELWLVGGLGLFLSLSFLFKIPFRKFTLPSSLSLSLLWLWFLMPVMLTILIFSPAFLKFLLVASPPLVLLLAVAINNSAEVIASVCFLYLFSSSGRSLTGPGVARSGDRPQLMLLNKYAFFIKSVLLTLVLLPSALSLYVYYTDPAYARDNYRGIAHFIKAVGGPEDAIILNAEGQQDVFTYYYEQDLPLEAPLYPLPRQRPLDEAATLAELQTIAERSERIYAVYWATQQADPTGLIETWLDQHLFKATDQWYGNVRLVSYGGWRGQADLTLRAVDYRLGENIRLVGYGLSNHQPRPADILQLALAWQAEAPLAANYTVFMQLLDPANHVVAQRDAQPSLPTSAWPVGERVDETYGLFIEPGTPPGLHRLIVGLYDNETGQRLPLAGADSPTNFIHLADLEIVLPAVLLPVEAFNIQTRLNVAMGEVTLLGYDLYKAGHRSDPESPLQPGDPLHLTLYWQAVRPVLGLEDQLFIQLVEGSQPALSMTRKPAGTDYPINQWAPGEIVRGQYDFFLSEIRPGTYRLAFTLISKLSGQRIVALSQPFRVE